MVKQESITGLYDPRNGGEAIRLSDLRIEHAAFEPDRTNCFSVYVIESGVGTFWADAARFSFAPDSLLFFVPYQHIKLVPESPIRATVIQFHANFLCVETFHAEAGCSGVLFNDPHGVPSVTLDDVTSPKFRDLIESLRREQTDRGLAFGEVMLANLKVLLILASRLKASMYRQSCGPAVYDPWHPVLIQFRDAIEQNYRTLHMPAEYAKKLFVTPKSLGRIVRENLGTTPSELIRARILTHAKWQILHTLRPIKEIAREVGFPD